MTGCLAILVSASGVSAAAAPAKKPQSFWRAVRWHAAGSVSSHSLVDDAVFASPSISGNVNAGFKNLTLSVGGSTTTAHTSRSFARLGLSYSQPWNGGRVIYAGGLISYSQLNKTAVSHRLTLANRWGDYTYDVGVSYQTLAVGNQKDVLGVQANIGRIVSDRVRLSAGVGDIRSRRGTYQTAKMSLTYVVASGTNITSTLSGSSQARGGWGRSGSLTFTLTQRFW